MLSCFELLNRIAEDIKKEESLRVICLIYKISEQQAEKEYLKWKENFNKPKYNKDIDKKKHSDSPRGYNYCNKEELIRLCKEGKRACDISMILGISVSCINYNKRELGLSK